MELEDTLNSTVELADIRRTAHSSHLEEDVLGSPRGLIHLKERTDSTHFHNAAVTEDTRVLKTPQVRTLWSIHALRCKETLFPRVSSSRR